MNVSKKIMFFTISMVALSNTNFAYSNKVLIDHVKQSIANAYAGKSKLTQDILNLPGMSSGKVRHFLNNICSLPQANYLEIGVWKGSTFISALYGNTHTLNDCIAIDNFSEFGAPKVDFLNNTHSFLPQNSFKFLDQDCFTVHSRTIFQDAVTIYFYDGNHTAESQETAFTYYDNILADTFIAIVDDWNHPPVEVGTRKAFAQLNYTILFEQALPASYNGDTANWWNGLYVAVIQKN